MRTETAETVVENAVTVHPPVHADAPPAGAGRGRLQVIRRNGKLTAFDPTKIQVAMTKAFLAVEGGTAAASRRVHETVEALTREVVSALTRRRPEGGTVHIEDIQDQVELALMRAGHHKVARAYVLYREERARERAARAAAQGGGRREEARLHWVRADGQRLPLDEAVLVARLEEACRGLEGVDAVRIAREAMKGLYDGIAEDELDQALLLAARGLIEQDPDHDFAAARLLLARLRREACAFLELAPPADGAAMAALYPDYFAAFVRRGIELELLDPRLAEFDLEALGRALRPERDLGFRYLGLQTLYDRYFQRWDGTRFELPQAFFMRVAMGLALNEVDREARAVEFYELLSSFDFMSSTPTLFNAGTTRPQLSSCYLTTVADDLDGIFTAIRHNALLSKYAGGLGNDWTRVRGMGAHIKGTNGTSQGVIPFLKVANDTAVAVNQGGRRKGAVCAYLEVWHIDFEDFLELRKNTGDERRRTHDMNTAAWVPDLFMKRVAEEGEWSLFSPDEVPDLHEKYGRAFEEAYLRYEEQALRGELRVHKRVKAVDLWRRLLTMLFETGHPWITFKDPCNLRYTNQHAGTVHSSNLCCIAADQRVVTDRGLLTVGELYRRGGQNRVMGLEGPVAASAMLLPRPNAPMVRIHTREGYTHKVTPDHKVWVKGRGWVEAQHLRPGDPLLIQQKEGLWGQAHNPELAYLMGLVAGDGTFTDGSVAIDLWETDFDLIEEVEHRVEALLATEPMRTSSVPAPRFRRYPEQRKARLCSAPLRRLMASAGLEPSRKLRVPRLVWEGDRETAAAYLRGLYQADGHVQATEETTTCVLASRDLEFLRELQILWANFGVKCSIGRMREAGEQELPDGRGGRRSYAVGPLYRLLITSVEGCRIAEEVTGLAARRRARSEAARRYLDHLAAKRGYRQKLWATFTHLETLPNEDAYCLTVYSPTHAWTVNGLITKNTEITLHTSDEEIAVCNLGSVNLARHVADGGLDLEKLRRTVRTAMRMLDNVIDINYYAVPHARRSNLRHRPVGLGVMGFQDLLHLLRVPYGSEEAVELADRSMEAVSYFAIEASADLAAERGRYPSYEGSLWSRGILPIDSLDRLAEERGGFLEVDRSRTLDWDALREKVRAQGMRNSNCLAIAPTATIANICGVSPSIEPTFQNLYVKSNLSGEFTVVNPHLVRELKAQGLWDEVMVHDLKYYDGSVAPIQRIPDELKALYATAFELDPRWLVEAAARRQKWIDQSQSLNLYLAEPSGRKLDALYKLAWVRGLKTTYYLRTRAATGVEKVAVREEGAAPPAPSATAEGAVCGLDGECEACQ